MCIELLTVTIIAGALKRAEEIPLAAEVCAFSPESAYSTPVKIEKRNWAILVLGVASSLGLVSIP